MNRKSELRKIVLDIIFEREPVRFEPTQFGHLTAGVAEILGRQGGHSPSAFAEPRLEENDELFVQEIFWDLIIERVITVGSDAANQAFPWFRVHSESSKR